MGLALAVVLGALIVAPEYALADGHDSDSKTSSQENGDQQTADPFGNTDTGGHSEKVLGEATLDVLTPGNPIPPAGNATEEDLSRGSGGAAAETVAVDWEPPCVGREGGSSSADTGSLSVEDAEAMEAERQAEEDRVLAGSTFGRSDSDDGSSDDGASSQASGDGLKDTAYVPVVVAAKPVKSASFWQDGDAKSAPSTLESNTAAVFEIWRDIRQQEAADNDFDTSSESVGDDESDCVEFYCYSERIEDVRFGHLSGEADGGFAEYVSTRAELISTIGDSVFDTIPFVNDLADFEVDHNDLADTISTNGLGARPTVTAMPVFYFCRSDAADGPIETIAEPYAPRFAWATTVEDEFDIAGTNNDHYERLRAQIVGTRPQIETIPPVEKGFTVVRLPSWLWLVDPFQGAIVETDSEFGTVRLASRATLLDVTWTIGNNTFTCIPEQMKPFIHGTSDIRTETSECMNRFTERVSYTITASARYYMEYRVAYNGGNQGGPFPDTPWVPYDDPDQRYVNVTNTTPRLEVHEILSVNVPQGMTDEEIKAYAQANIAPFDYPELNPGTEPETNDDDEGND